MIRLHRLLMNPGPGEQVDHRNHNGLDNRRENLRLATAAQNAANARPKRNRPGYKGVNWHKRNQKWRAYITVDRKYIHLGVFEDPWEAAQAYNTAALEAWGEFACLNEKQPELLGGNSRAQPIAS
jgi:hypothetical protein